MAMPRTNRFPGLPGFPPDLVNLCIYGWEVIHQLFLAEKAGIIPGLGRSGWERGMGRFGPDHMLKRKIYVNICQNRFFFLFRTPCHNKHKSGFSKENLNEKG